MREIDAAALDRLAAVPSRLNAEPQIYLPQTAYSWSCSHDRRGRGRGRILTWSVALSHSGQVAQSPPFPLSPPSMWAHVRAVSMSNHHHHACRTTPAGVAICAGPRLIAAMSH
ncbi:hypothetical protein M433DRAFT_130333 [Acidomyces richmondensis BFW]|nr:hypothetical protein M433DRAFT_130333 [Acidomyces richmondensis BFW]